MTYAILPAVATLGVACLVSVLAENFMARRRRAEIVLGRSSAAALPDVLDPWMSNDRHEPKSKLVVTRFGQGVATRPYVGPARDEVEVRLERLRRALDQLNGLLLVLTSGEHGATRFLVRANSPPVDRQVATAARAMRRLGALMLSANGGETILVAPSAVGEPSDAEAPRAQWSDFLAALAFLTNACERHAATIHLSEVDAAALAIEELCLSLAQVDSASNDSERFGAFDLKIV